MEASVLGLVQAQLIVLNRRRFQIQIIGASMRELLLVDVTAKVVVQNSKQPRADGLFKTLGSVLRSKRFEFGFLYQVIRFDQFADQTGTSL